ncbi:MAG: 5-methyltetrahydropteroyltriglutamate--homocysteine S-methyltransferase [Gammaproteobacteria bacterium]|nr:5-methyltetrahydropteroyltriglutamate--homocysteine S-methyltransferase [Gammaproteobacteria bacterium]
MQTFTPAPGQHVRKPTLRADQIGSLLRPARLVEARKRHATGVLDRAGLRATEDDCIRNAVRRQEAAGLHAITDGDFRRESFHIDFLTRMRGIRWDSMRFQQGFQGGPGAGESPAVFRVTDKITHPDDICVEDFRFLAMTTSRVGKVTMPSPSFAHCRGGRAAIDRAAYPDLGAFFDDLAAAYCAEILALGEAGCRYVQLDEVHYTFFCDPAMAAALRARGDEPEQLAVIYADLINAAIAGRPEGMSVGVHLCRGNKQSSWVAQGGYEPVAELLFNTVKSDRFLLEYDTDRAGGFEPLRFVPKGPIIVLGLVTTKSGDMESRDALLRRIEEAARFVPIEQLALSPQCGFASSIEGNKLDETAQWDKLALIVELAEEVWGSAA